MKLINLTIRYDMMESFDNASNFENYVCKII